MPARDVFHDAVRRALERAGWTIAADPLHLAIGRRSLFIDLAAERLLAAEKHGVAIAVEVKSFVGPSEIEDLEMAPGQYALYERALRAVEPSRRLWLAVPQAVREGLLEEALGELLLSDGSIRLLVFDPDAEEIREWIPATDTATSSSRS